MDVRLSAEQRALADSVDQVVSQLGPATVAALDDRERATRLDAAVAAAGWRELRSTSSAGRPWASGVEVALVAEGLGRGRADAPFLGPTLAADLRRLAGAPPTSSSETVLLTTDLSGPARPGESGVAIDAAGASTALVLMPRPVGYSLASVTVSAPAVGVDLTRPTVVVPAGTVSTPVGGQTLSISRETVAHWTALGLVATCGDLLGSMQGALDLSVEYAGQRTQFGQPIGSFQAVQHLLADAVVQLEGSRSTTLYAAWAVDALPPDDALGAAAAAKAYAARAARLVCEAAIQVHGGIGNTWDCLAHVYLRRTLLATDVLGGIGPSLARVLAHHGVGGGDGLR